MEQIVALGIAAVLAVGGVLGPATPFSSAAPSSLAVPSSSAVETPAQPVTLDLSFETLQKAEQARELEKLPQVEDIEQIETIIEYVRGLSPQKILELTVELARTIQGKNDQVMAFLLVLNPFVEKVMPALPFEDMEHLMTAGELSEYFHYFMITAINYHYYYWAADPIPEVDELFAKVATDPAQSHMIQQEAATSIYGKELATKVLIEKYDELEDKEKGQVYLRRLKDKDKEAYEERYQAYLDWKKNRRRK